MEERSRSEKNSKRRRSYGKILIDNRGKPVVRLELENNKKEVKIR